MNDVAFSPPEALSFNHDHRTRWARGVKLARDVATGLIAPVSMSIGRCRDGTLTVKLDSSNKVTLLDLAERLGELAADLWLDGKLNVG